MKRILERGKLLSNKKNPVSKRFMDSWEKQVKNIIYPERLNEWRELGVGVWSGVVDKNTIEVAVDVMQELQDNQTFEKVKADMDEIKKEKLYDIQKIMKTVLNFSKKGPEFYLDYYKIKDTFCYQKIEAIQNENFEFEQNFQKQLKNNQKEREQ
ncbi:MAG: hypothetical protein PHQ62_01160 [Clostridia bacterium]|nr:hypothetical protein [Clostridia bacterium]